MERRKKMLQYVSPALLSTLPKKVVTVMRYPSIRAAYYKTCARYERFYGRWIRTRPVESRIKWDNERKNRAFGILRKTGTPCSCWMCGNPRKFGEGMTLAERREMERMDSEEEEFFSMTG